MSEAPRDPVESTLEKNLRALLQRAYRPIEASPEFRESLRARVIEEAAATLASRRGARVRLTRLAVAATILLVAGGALLAMVLLRGASTHDERVAELHAIELRSDSEARTVDVRGGRLELLPETLVELRDLGGASWSLDLRQGEARLHRDDSPELRILRTEGVDVSALSDHDRYDLRLSRTRGDETVKWNRVLIPAGLGVGGLVVYLTVHDGAVEIRNPQGKEIVLASEAAVVAGDRAPSRLPAPGATASAASSVEERPAVRPNVSGIVRDASGRPIAGARVEPGSLASGGHFELSGKAASTDDGGRFAIATDSSRVRLRASASGYATRLGEEIAVAAPGVSDVVLELLEGGTILGRVTDDTGAGIEGAHLSALPQETIGGDVALSAETDASGNFALQGLSDGVVYLVDATKHDHGAAQVLNVRAHAQDVNFVLPRLAGVAGRVVDDADFSPLPKFRVTVQRDVVAYDRPDPVSRDVESTDGSFRVTGIEPGDYSVFVSSPGFATRCLTAVSVTPAHVTDGLLARLERGGAIRGRVVLRGSAEPVANALVYSFTDVPPRPLGEPHEPDTEATTGYCTRTSADGSFELSHLSAGLHSLAAEHPEFAPDRRVSIEVSTGQITEGVTLQLSSGGAIAGTVKDDAGKPIAQALMFAVEVGRDARDSFVRGAYTDEAGQYSIPHVMPGHYVVGMEPSVESSPYAVNRTTSATIVDGQTAIVNFPTEQRGTRLFGLVTDSKGKPFPQIWLTAVRVGGKEAGADIQFRSGMTDSEGRYEIRDLKAGNYAIYLQQGFKMSFTYAAYLPVAATPEDLRRDFTYSDAQVGGVVRDASTGSPIANASAMLNLMMPGASQPFFAGRTQADANGAFSFQGLVPGRYQLVVLAAGFGQGTIESLELQADQKMTDLEFRLEKGGSLLVKVTDAEGAPVQGVFVIVSDSKGVSVADMSAIPKTNAAGEYALPGLKSGRYVVRVANPAGGGVEQQVDVTAGQQATATIELKPASDR